MGVAVGGRFKMGLTVTPPFFVDRNVSVKGETFFRNNLEISDQIQIQIHNSNNHAIFRYEDEQSADRQKSNYTNSNDYL